MVPGLSNFNEHWPQHLWASPRKIIEFGQWFRWAVSQGFGCNSLWSEGLLLAQKARGAQLSHVNDYEFPSGSSKKIERTLKIVANLLMISGSEQKKFRVIQIRIVLVALMLSPNFTYENHAFFTLTNCHSHKNRNFSVKFFWVMLSQVDNVHRKFQPVL